MRLAGLDRGPQRRSTARAGASGRRTPRACAAASAPRAAGRAAGARGRRLVGHVEEPSHCAKYARRARRPPRAPWPGSGAGSASLGFGGPPAHVALLRDLTVDRRRLDRRARVRGRVRRLQPAARPGEHADGDLQRPARRRPRRARSSAGSRFILPGLVAGAGDRRASRSATSRRPPSTAFGAGAAAAVVAVVVQAGLKLIDPRRGPRLRDRRRRSAPRSPARTWSRSCCSPAASSSARAHAPGHRVWPALIWLAVKVGALSYGGGYVIIPLMYGDAVEAQRWMSEQEFANAVAYGQITPGPVTHTVALVGYAAGGLGGALVATAVAFAPSVRVGHARRAALRAAAHEPATRARSSTAPGPPRRARSSAPRSRSRSAIETRWQWVVLAAAAVALARCASRRSAVLVGGAVVGRRHYALAMGLAEELQDETAEVLSSADPLQHRQPAGQRARVPGVARGLPGGRGARGRAGRRRAGAPEPRGHAAAAATARRSATSRTSTPCSPTPRTGAPTRGAPSIRDGFLYGRGAIDMKNQTAAEAVAAARLARAGAQVRRHAEGDQRRRRGDRRRRSAPSGSPRSGPTSRASTTCSTRARARSCPTATAACTASAWPRRARSASTCARAAPPPTPRCPGLADNALLKLAPADHQARRGPARLRPDRGHAARCSRRSARTPRDPKAALERDRAPSRRSSRRCSTPR